MREVMIRTEDQSGTLPVRKRRDGAPDRGRPLLSEYAVAWTLCPIVDEAVLANRFGLRLLGADAIETSIDGDAIQPSRQGGVALEGPQSPPRAHEGFLGEVARVFVVAREPVADLIDGPPVSGHDDIKGRGLSTETLDDERPIIE